MPAPRRTLTIDGAREEIERRSFAAPDGDRRRVGIEAEWFIVDERDADRRVPPDETAALLPDTLPAGGTITFEPGGQLELATMPHEDLGALIDAADVDLRVIDAALAAGGLARRGGGMDERPASKRFATAPRYRAMEDYFDASGPAGRVMMRSTASLQLNVDATPERWWRANVLAPTLVSLFSASERPAVWAAIDPTRTGPPPLDDWAGYALAARVMCIRVDDGTYVAQREPLSLERWIEAGHPLGWPTLDDVAYHLTTLFPPVRPRGWLEVRYLDAPPHDGWQVPVAIVAALLLDDEAGEAGERATGATAPNRCLAAAVAALPRLAAPADTIAACSRFARACRADRVMTGS